MHHEKLFQIIKDKIRKNRITLDYEYKVGDKLKLNDKCT